MEYKGWKIERFEGWAGGYTTQRSTLTKVGIGTRKKIKGWEVYYPDGGGSKIFSTLKEAKRYIDNY